MYMTLWMFWFQEKNLSTLINYEACHTCRPSVHHAYTPDFALERPSLDEANAAFVGQLQINLVGCQQNNGNGQSTSSQTVTQREQIYFHILEIQVSLMDSKYLYKPPWLQTHRFFGLVMAILFHKFEGNCLCLTQQASFNLTMTSKFGPKIWVSLHPSQNKSWPQCISLRCQEAHIKICLNERWAK